MHLCTNSFIEVYMEERMMYLNFNVIGSCMPRLHIQNSGACRKWKDEDRTNPLTPPLADWVERYVRDLEMDLRDPNEMDRFLLSKKPSQRATRYTRITAFGNHFRVEDETTSRLVSYNSGVASTFELPPGGTPEMFVNYVGVLQDILQLDYGGLHTQIILLRCEWMKPQDNRGNSTYIRDESGFLVVNFRHKLPRMVEPFIFPSQATQVFFSDVVEKPGWKVVLRKEARAKREVVETTDAFITTTVESAGLTAPRRMPMPTETVNLVGAIELSVEENLLAHEEY